MFRRGYNKLIFSVFSESKDYLIFIVYALKLGRIFLSFLQINYTKTDISGKFLPSYKYTSRLKLIDCSEWDIVFSRGRIFFKDKAVKLEFASDTVMIYLNFSCINSNSDLLNSFSNSGITNGPFTIKSCNYENLVKGCLVTPNNKVEFNNASGNIDMIFSNEAKPRFKSLLWCRLHSKELDIAYTVIHNGAEKSKTSLNLFHNNKLVRFSEVDLHSDKERFSYRTKIKYPGDLLLKARNDDYQMILNIREQTEVTVSEKVDNLNIFDRMIIRLFRVLTGNQKEINLISGADVSINNHSEQMDYKNVTSITEYVTFVL